MGEGAAVGEGEELCECVGTVRPAEESSVTDLLRRRTRVRLLEVGRTRCCAKEGRER